jgi:hypothetical protein
MKRKGFIDCLKPKGAHVQRGGDGFDTEAWDKQFEEDAATGRLDDLADEAIRDLREGRCTDL